MKFAILVALPFLRPITLIISLGWADDEDDEHIVLSPAGRFGFNMPDEIEEDDEHERTRSPRAH